MLLGFMFCYLNMCTKFLIGIIWLGFLKLLSIKHSLRVSYESSPHWFSTEVLNWVRFSEELKKKFSKFFIWYAGWLKTTFYFYSISSGFLQLNSFLRYFLCIYSCTCSFYLQNGIFNAVIIFSQFCRYLALQRGIVIHLKKKWLKFAQECCVLSYK